MYEYYSNTLEFISLMHQIDYIEFNKLLDTVPELDIGQYVRRLTEEETGIEEGDDPSDTALRILRELVLKYPKKKEEMR